MGPGVDVPKELNTVYEKPLPTDSSHCAVTTSPNAAAKKKLAMKALYMVTPRHSIRPIARVVSVVAKTPIGSAVCQSQRDSLHISGRLTPAPKLFGAAATTVESNSTVRCFSMSTRPTPVLPLGSNSSVEENISRAILSCYFAR